ncbi:exocyst complex component 3-like protein 4 [Sphaeramia orbicularis]|uniref:exocyst complex component 3-like protein 4 n=1 Tax=Sphaeramia orbicularis TaxID=375764 RepID=UPI00117E3DC6|nr:exocyst complex component 3-like protein 4 [Sphaeramia orbicularis]
MTLNVFKRWRTPRRTESITPLIRNNNNDEDTQDGYERQVNDHKDPLTQNTLNIQNEHHLQNDDEITSLAEHLRVPADSISVRPYCSENQPENLEQKVFALIQTSVHKQLPKPPEDLDKNLQQYLIRVQEIVLRELQRLAPLFDIRGLMGDLIDCYHNQIFKQLNGVLQQIRSSKSCFVLLQWLLQIYLSQDLLGHPDFKEMDVTRTIDLMLLIDCTTKAQNILLDLVQKEVSKTLEKILLKSQERGNKSDEDLNETYIDTIQCINAMSNQALKISSRLSVRVQEICLEELLIFVRRYTSQQTENLEKSKMTKIDTFDFFKTLKTCRELKHHVPTKHKGVKVSVVKETVELLEEMQDFTKKRLLGNVAVVTETHLKKYFRADSKQFLVGALRELFPNLSSCLDEQKSVMDEVYKHTVHLYLKHLINTNQKKLVKCWRRGIGETVTDDAELIHITFSDLAPGVQQWNFTLLEVSEVLNYPYGDTLKLTVGGMKNKCTNTGCTDDLELLPALLRWKGLSKWQVRDILEALPDHRPKTRPALWSCFPFCGKIQN